MPDNGPDPTKNPAYLRALAKQAAVRKNREIYGDKYPNGPTAPKPLNSYGHANLHDKESKRKD
jgi:hypothetical protein